MKIFTKQFLSLGLLLVLYYTLFPIGSIHAQPIATVTVGTGTGNSYDFPINSCMGYTYSQQIYTAQQILDANGGNMPTTNTITKIRFYYTDWSWVSNTSNSDNWTVYIGNTALTSFSSSTSWVSSSDMTEVYSGTVTIPAQNNWVEIVLTTPFDWDGTSSIVVGVDENDANWDCSMTWQSSNQTNDQSISVVDNSNNPDPASPPSGSTSSTLANIQFDFLIPPDNAGVDSVFVPQYPFCSGPQTVKARIHNYGSNVINNVTINWTVDDVLQPAVNSSSLIDMENTTAGPEATVVLGTVDFPYTVNRVIKAWTSMPNGTNDNKPGNDTASANIAGILEGVVVNVKPQDTTICQGNTISLDAGEFPHNPIYIWSNNTLNRSLDVSEAGTYTVKVQNDMGCSDRDTVHVTVYPDPRVNSIAVISDGNTITFNVILPQDVSSYIWDFGDGTIPQEVTGTPGQEIHQYTEPGEYTVTLTVKNQCGEVTVTRVLVIVDVATGIGDLSGLQKEISIYPNPSKDVVRISNKAGIRMKEVAIVNLMGQNVYTRGKLNTDKLEIDISAMASGIYNVVIATELGKVTKKLEVIK